MKSDSSFLMNHKILLPSLLVTVAALTSLSEHVLPSLDPTVKDYVKSVSRAQFMLVLHTELGEADVLANIIDSDENPEILGTVAGADTLLVICKDAVVAERLESEFH